ncbi:DMT family transporter [Sulfitobacter sp. M57]|uniref:DMT family transporter n=1 Tax=unclassified Sulfitobacter TaxID=196795 RepID=UPI0023E1A04D|nr:MULTISPECIES: DMT family transporter [unclassified Sulfitobacter]MDF3416247.1 DMT family transporter [Sulfitobacter sp. KE5]MDF3423726.1 DMT family transporter [Sulfitobacter sp. KE43]MDF3434793.1 DMT family transporter [Sulfitobacter sp. KE42]MDF3460432.1 DMT family transporter [Sulfitobacter sp. S74]MDF3464330.1 DMT family transporter [Sulfitobacter sp. Ks18]
MTDQAKGVWITLMGVLFVVPDSLFVRLIAADALTVAFWRLLLAGGLSALWILASAGTGPFRAVLRTGRYGAVYMAGVGASGVLFVLAVSLTSVANVVFIIASLPVFASLFSRVFLSEPFGLRTWLTIAAVVPGLSIIAYGSGETQNASLAGDLLALGVSALFAAALTAARHVRRVSMVPGVAMGYLLAALVIAPFSAPLTMPLDQSALVLAHGLFILASSILLAIGPRYITSAEVGLLVLLESVLAPLLAWAVVGEDPGRYTLLGGAIVICALLVSNLVLLLRQRRSV